MVWADNNYIKRKKLTIDGSLVSGNQTDFPVLYSGNVDSDLAGINPYSIKFYDSGNALPLSYEFDLWDSSTGALIAWVKLPRIVSSTCTTNAISSNTFWLYYDYPGESSDQQSVADVWSNEFIVVYHMSGAANTIVDSVGTQSGTKSGSSTTNPTQVDGKIGWAQDFGGHGSVDWINLEGLTTSAGQSYTFSWWENAHADSLNYTNYIFDSSGNTSAERTIIYWYVGGDLRWYVAGEYSEWYTPAAGKWTYVSIVADADANDVYGYVSGNLYPISDNDDPYTNDPAFDNAIKIGTRYAEMNGQWMGHSGSIDEFRIASGARDQSWLFTEYQNQNDPTVFISKGTQEILTIFKVSSNGCYISTQSTATISSQLWAGSGTAWVVWDTSDKGTSAIGDWTNSAKDGSVRYSGAANAWAYQITTGLIPNTNYSTRTYVSSNWEANIDDWSNLTTFRTSSAGLVYVVSSNGCYISTQSTATISSQLWAGSGTAWLAWGTSDGGESFSGWDSSGQVTGVQYSGAANAWKYQITTGLSPDRIFYSRTYISSNWVPEINDWSNLITFYTAPDTAYYTEGNSLRIYVSCNNYPNNYIDCWCTRWDEGNWDVTFETFLGSGARDFLFSNVTPGAVRELYNILGTPRFIDTTYKSGNSIRIFPIAGTGLYNLREERIIAVKNISDSFITPDRFHIKVEGQRIDI